MAQEGLRHHQRAQRQGSLSRSSRPLAAPALNLLVSRAAETSWWRSQEAQWRDQQTQRWRQGREARSSQAQRAPQVLHPSALARKLRPLPGLDCRRARLLSPAAGCQRACSEHRDVPRQTAQQHPRPRLPLSDLRPRLLLATPPPRARLGRCWAAPAGWPLAPDAWPHSAAPLRKAQAAERLWCCRVAAAPVQPCLAAQAPPALAASAARRRTRQAPHVPAERGPLARALAGAGRASPPASRPSRLLARVKETQPVARRRVQAVQLRPPPPCTAARRRRCKG